MKSTTKLRVIISLYLYIYLLPGKWALKVFEFSHTIDSACNALNGVLDDLLNTNYFGLSSLNLRILDSHTMDSDDLLNTNYFEPAKRYLILYILFYQGITYSTMWFCVRSIIFVYSFFIRFILKTIYSFKVFIIWLLKTIHNFHFKKYSIRPTLGLSWVRHEF